MGFFSSIGGAIGSALSGVGSFFSGAVSSLGGIGSSIFSGLSSLGSFLGPIGAIVSGIGFVSGLFKKETDLEDLGFQIREARNRGIVRENFDSYDQFFDSVTEMPIDKQNTSDSDKWDARRLGTTYTMLGINEKAGQEIKLGTYEFIEKTNIDSKNISISDVKSINNVLDGNNVTSSKLDKYKNNELVGVDRENVDNALTEISGIVNIDKSELLK